MRGRVVQILFLGLTAVAPLLAQAPAAPTLLQPGDGASNLPATVSLTWQPAAGATSYTLQVAATADFAAPVANRSGLTSPTGSVSGLLSFTVYYWRVAALNVQGTSAWSATRQFTTRPTLPPNPPTPQAPAPGATGVTPYTALSWSAPPSALAYEAQVAKTPSFTSPVLDRFNLTTPTFLAGLLYSTTYYWRVRAQNIVGQGAWSSARSFTTNAYITLPAPTLSAPANGLTGVRAYDIYQNPVSVPLFWQAVPNATDYFVQVALDAAFVKAVYWQDVTSPTAAVPGLAPSTRYYWRVTPILSARGVGMPSLPWSFTTAPKVSGAPVPTLATPVDGAQNQPNTVTCKWNAVTGAIYYSIEVATDAAFTRLVAYQTLNGGLMATITPLTCGGQYWWRVGASTAPGANPSWSSWSSARSFSTWALPAPTLTAPSNGATGVSLAPQLAWSSISGATSYEVQLSADNTFATLITLPSQPTVASLTIPAQPMQTGRWWRARAINARGTSDWSAAWQFTTGVLAAPVLLAPADGADSLDPAGAGLAWAAVAGATNYLVEVATAADFNADSLVLQPNNITDVTLVANTLLPGATYYWRVAASCSTVTGPFSATWSFTTNAAGLAAPTIIYPANNETDVPTTFEANWSVVTGATNYIFSVARDIDFTNVAVTYGQDALFAPHHVTISGLTAGQTYYCRARAVDGAYDGPWSLTCCFTATAYAPPVLTSPPDGATGIPVHLNNRQNFVFPGDTVLDELWTQIIWDIDPPAAPKYELQITIAPDTAFTSPVCDKIITLPITSVVSTVNNDGTVPQQYSDTAWNGNNFLNHQLTYIWRERAYNGAVWMDWSPSRAFTIDDIHVQTRDGDIWHCAQKYPALLTPGWGQTGVSLTGATVTWLRSVIQPPVAGQPPSSDWLQYLWTVPFSEYTLSYGQYCLQVARDKNFTDLLVNEKGIPSPTGSTTYIVTHPLPTLAPNTTYWWRICAGDGTYWGPWSPAIWFTTGSR